MCGILGVHKFNSIKFSVFEEQLKVILHRGPDNGGTWFNENNSVGLGSRRLAIQDLSDNANMPMFSYNHKYIIVFNGEIYNCKELKKSLLKLGYKFKSNSDTECVLHSYTQWGLNCLERLEGMFAIAIYDRQKNTFFLARDRAGEKPIYYCKNNFGFSFSSEIKQLLIDQENSKKINKVALKQFLEDGFIRGRESFIENIFKLPAGSFLIYSLNDSKIFVKKYWDIPPKKAVKSKKEILEKLDILLSNAVETQMISDVPLGVLLSGGVDSSLIATYAAQKVDNLKTFNITFNEHKDLNESEYAKKVANYLGSQHFELDASNVDIDLIDDLVEYFDEQLADSSMLPTFIVSKLTREHVTVALGGDGGDELFGGYSHYLTYSKRHHAIDTSTKYFEKITQKVASSLPLGFKGRNFLLNSIGDSYERFMTNRLFDQFSLKKILSEEYFEEIKNLKSKAFLEKTNSLIYDLTKYDFKNYLVDDILVKIDRASMASSLELRAPFLDKNIIEFAFSEIDDTWKVNNNNLKIILKELLKNKLPINLDQNRKQGFSIPLNKWISTNWFEYFLNEIDELEKIFNKDYVFKMCLNIKRGYSNSSRLFALIMLNKWIKKYNISI